MIASPVSPASLVFVDDLAISLAVDQPASGLPTAILALDAAAQDATADARSALDDYRYADAATAIGKLSIAQQQIRAAFDATVTGQPLFPILQASARWVKMSDALSTALVDLRGF